MTITKRMLAVLLTVCMLLTMAPAMVLISSAAGGQEQTLIQAGSDWKYYYFSDNDAYNADLNLTWPASYPEGWQNAGFDTSDWLIGGAPFTGPAYSNAAAKTLLNVPTSMTLYAAFVQTFTLSDGFSPDELILSLYYDENPEVYLNGTLVCKKSGYNTSMGKYDLSEYADLLHGGVNTVAVKMSNAVNGGGFNFDLELVAKAGSTDLKLIKEKDEWQYFYYTTDAEKNASLGVSWSEAPEGWYLPTADRSDWLTGNGFFAGASWPKSGYGTKLNVTQDYELHAGFAKTFTLTDASEISALVMGIMYDENPVVYLNGTKIFTASGYKDSAYVEVNLNQYKNLLVDGENVIAASMENAIRGGGFLFAMTLTASVEPLPLYNGDQAVIDSASSNWAWAGQALGAASNIYDNNPTSCCGAAFTPDNYIIANFRGPVELNKLYIESKAEGSTTAEDGSYGLYDIYALQDDEYVLIAEDVISYTHAMNGNYVVLPETVTTTAIKIVVTAWTGNNWANVSEFAAYRALDTVTVNYMADGKLVASRTVKKGATLDELKLPEPPAKPGYSVVWDQTITPTTVLSADLTVNAVYTELRSYTVTFVANGEVVLQKTLLAGEVFSETDYPDVPEKAYYTGNWDHAGNLSGADIVVTAVYTDTRDNLVTADNLISYVNGTPKSNPWGAIGQASNVADGDPSTVWGWGFEAGMYLEATFDQYYEISRILVGCKKEGTPNAAGEYGMYTIAYLAQNGEWTTLAENIAAKPVVEGGANLEFSPVVAKAIRLIPTAWFTADWAGAAEWQVYGLASDVKDTYQITWTDGVQTVVTEVEEGAMPLPPAQFVSYTEGNIRYTLTGWSPAIEVVSGPATYTAVYSQQDLSALTMTVASAGIYNDEDDEGEDVTVLAIKLAYYNGLWASDLFEAEYTWVFTVNGVAYEIAPEAVAASTGRFLFYPCLAETPFIPVADATYTISLSIYDGETELYHTNAIEIATDEDFEPVAPTVEVIPGDVNGDGTVSIEDVSAMLIMLAEGKISEVADLNGDGVLSIRDVTLLLTALAG